MGDYRRLPAWTRALGLAHALCAALEGAGLKHAPETAAIRRAAVSVPSLVAEAHLESTREAGAVLRSALDRLDEIRALLGRDPFRSRLPEADRRALLSEVDQVSVEVRAAAAVDAAAPGEPI